MIAVHKYPITFETNIMMPKDAKILTVQVQNNLPFIWAEVDTDEMKYPRKFMMFGTGHQIPSHMSRRYIGTIQEAGGALIWHVYEML